jgi:hypothetical protein
LAGATFYRYGIGAESSAKRVLSLQSVLRLPEFADGSDLVVKMDIEGHEWLALEAAPAEFFHRSRQVVIEMHEWRLCGEPQWADRARRVLARIRESHVPVHLHANNAVPIVRLGNLACPDALEVTFLRDELVEVRDHPTAFLTALDRPNDPRIPEVCLDGWIDRTGDDPGPGRSRP